MTNEELQAFAVERHGEAAPWVELSKETGFSVSHLWRCAYKNRPISNKLAKTLNLLRPLRDGVRK